MLEIKRNINIWINFFSQCWMLKNPFTEFLFAVQKIIKCTTCPWSPVRLGARQDGSGTYRENNCLSSAFRAKERQLNQHDTLYLSCWNYGRGMTKAYTGLNLGVPDYLFEIKPCVTIVKPVLLQCNNSVWEPFKTPQHGRTWSEAQLCHWSLRGQ